MVHDWINRVTTVSSRESRKPEKITILYISANVSTNPLISGADSTSEDKLSLDEEVREIEAKIRASEYRDSIQFVTKWAARPDDLLQSLLQHKPHIVHFSGHGSPTEEIVLLDRNGDAKPVSKQALVSVFRTLKANVRVVVLNACFSRPQAEAITSVIDCAIGMKRGFGDYAAVVFAASFYRAIGFGQSVKDAFEQGKAALEMEGLSRDARTPKLMSRKSVNASSIVLISPQ
jgi:hypothetical protein